MTKYEKLVDEITTSTDIALLDTNSETIPAQSVCIDDHCAVFLNEKAFDTESERFIVLAHEKAHCDTGTFYNTSSPMFLREKFENTAWKRTVLDVLSYDELEDAMHECSIYGEVTLYTLSEELDLPEQFIEEAIKQYKAMGYTFGE